MIVRTSRPFVFSALLHAVAAGLLLLFMLQSRREPVPATSIVEVIPDPVRTQAGPPERSAQVSFTPVKVVAPVREQAAEEEVVQPARLVVTHQSTPQRTITRPTTTITEHRRQNPAQAERARVASTATSPKIDLSEVLAESGPQRAAPSAAVGGGQSADYFARLLGKLRAAHEKPAGLDDGLQAKVEFVLRADGTVGDARIVQSSGSDAFDASVLAAFRRLRDLGAPPAGAAGTNQVTFRTRAE